MKNDLINALENRGYKAKLVSAAEVWELVEEIDNRYRNKQINPKIYENYLKFNTDNIKESGSILSVAVKLPIINLTFKLNNKEVPVIVPPGYIGSDIVEKFTNDIKSIFQERNLEYKKCKLPQKLLASRTGLGRYGKNNIMYVRGFGSFLMLSSYFVDIPCEEGFIEPQIADECTACGICMSSCPTGALSKSNFMVDTSKCITFPNEVGGVFEEWIQPSWHNSLIGCFYCQSNCPMNKPYLSDIRTYPAFTEEETNAFYNEVPAEKLSVETQEKLKAIEFYDGYEIFTRNLKVLLEKHIMKNK